MLMTKMPPKVTSSMLMRNAQPVSPPMVPESSVRIKLCQIASVKLSCSPPSGDIPTTVTNPAITTTTSAESRPSRPIRAIVPRDMVLSKA